MISNKFSIYSKKQKAILKAIDIVQVTFGIIFIIFIVFAMLYTSASFNALTIIMGIAAIISLLEFVNRIVIKRKPVAYRLLIRFFKSKNMLFVPTSKQYDVCEWIKTNVINHDGVFIYGNPEVGKTSSVFIFLALNSGDIDYINSMNWSNDIIYIDCKNNKKNILDYIELPESRKFDKAHEGGLIIIDNLEEMGELFKENLFAFMDNSLNKYVILYDFNRTDDAIGKNVAYKHIDDHTQHSYEETFENYLLSDYELRILLIIYFISLSYTLIPLNSIFVDYFTIISRRRFNTYVNNLTKKGYLKRFPFDKSYVLVTKYTYCFIRHYYAKDTCKKVFPVHPIILSSEKYPESAWIFLLRLPFELIESINYDERKLIFDLAMNTCNYRSLLRAAENELQYNPQKENLFLYEIATLLFYNSQQQKAFEKYDFLIQNRHVGDSKNTIMLKIIEVTHGEADDITQNNINSYIQYLLDAGMEYGLYAKYWTLHIQSERGVFKFKEYTDLLNDLNNYSFSLKENNLFFEIKKRCYTDLIRISHILMQDIPLDIKSGFINFLEAQYRDNKEVLEYYSALYIKANTLHYLSLMNEILEYRDCNETYNQGLAEYNNAMLCGYENYKSLSACELKYIDFIIYDKCSAEDYNKYESTIKKFMINAEINKVSVHVAYCKTLLAKLYMIKNLNNPDYRITRNRKKMDSNIVSNLRDAKKIYTKYCNDYGIIRANYLKTLYDIALSSKKNELPSLVKKLESYILSHNEYCREKRIIQYYHNVITTNSSYAMPAFAILKAYPIILQ